MIDQGFRREIQSLPIECSFCDWIGVINRYQVIFYLLNLFLSLFLFFFLTQSHIKYFHPNPNCNNCGEKFDSVHKLNEHRVLRCQKITGDCLLKEFGCEEPVRILVSWNKYIYLFVFFRLFVAIKRSTMIATGIKKY